MRERSTEKATHEQRWHKEEKPHCEEGVAPPPPPPSLVFLIFFVFVPCQAVDFFGVVVCCFCTGPCLACDLLVTLQKDVRLPAWSKTVFCLLIVLGAFPLPALSCLLFSLVFALLFLVQRYEFRCH